MTPHSDVSPQLGGPKTWLKAASLSYVGIFFGAALLVGYLGGAWLDRRLHAAPWLSVVGVLCGVAAGFTELLRILRMIQRRPDPEEQRDQKTP